MKKKLIIGLIIVVVIVAIAIYFYKKNKKAKELASVDVQSMAGLSPELRTQNTTAQAVAPTQVQQTNPNPAAKVFNYVTVVRDGSRGTATLMYQPLVDSFKVGDSVKIASGPYAGTHKIWHIYNFTQGGLVAGAGQNLYLETPYTVADKGTFSKA